MDPGGGAGGTRRGHGGAGRDRDRDFVFPESGWSGIFLDLGLMINPGTLLGLGWNSWNSAREGARGAAPGG